MLCQHCQKNIANVHFTQIINNNKIEMYLCEKCAKENGKISFASHINMSDFFPGLIGYDYDSRFLENSEGNAVCEKCGMSFEDFQKTGKLGCSNCYEIYGSKLRSVLKRLHGNAEHHGKIPQRVSTGVRTSKEIEKLRKELGKAIQGEEYERAAEIRDKIKSLEVKDV